MKLGRNLVWLFAIMCLPAMVASSFAQTRPADPLQVGEHSVEINGLKLWYKVSGTGPVCVMPTPAWGPSSDMYFRTLRSLEKSFTVVYLDSRGTGRSGRAATSSEYTWDHLVKDLEGLREHLGQQRLWLMGHSEGGMQVLHYACDFPDRVAGMVLIDTFAVANTEVRADREMRIDRRKDDPRFAQAVKAIREGVKPGQPMGKHIASILDLYWSDPRKGDAFREAFDATTFSDEASAGQRDSKRFPFDLRQRLKAVKAPALIIVGDDDFICSVESARTLHLALANSKLLVIEECGHFPWMEQPQVFETQVPQFLAALGLGTP